jgi:hypothetical protein
VHCANATAQFVAAASICFISRLHLGGRGSFRGPTSSSSGCPGETSERNCCRSRRRAASASSCISTSDLLSAFSHSGSLGGGQRGKTRNDFRAAMLLAQNACSDILEEDSTSAASNSLGGFQMKRLCTKNPAESEMQLKTSNADEVFNYKQLCI